MGYGDFNLDLPDGENFEPDAERVRAFSEMMLPGRYHLAEPGTNRDAWDKLREGKIGGQLLEAAVEIAAERPVPYLDNELYEYTLREKNRDRINPVMPSVRSRTTLLPLAEALEPDGKYLPQIERDIEALAQLDNWNYPNNDVHKAHGYFVDLVSVSHASKLVAMDRLLQDRLSPELRRTIREQVDKQVFRPFEKGIRSGKGIYWWVTVTHNWNSVCMAEILGCALYLKEDPEERAWYLALAEKVLPYSEKGFEESGFYTEGVSYWNYGFGHYVLAAELVRAVTAGKIDWLKKPKVQKVSEFGARMEIQDGIYPSFADCKSTFQPDPWLVHWLNNRIDESREKRDTKTPIDPLENRNFQNLSVIFLNLFHQVDPDEAYAREFPFSEREWFEDVQFLICRPNRDSQTRMAATFKGGHNGVNHNHNDLGTMTILLGDRELIADPGAEVYTYRTFSKYRYHGDLLNSFGHPVPVVAGKLQDPGKDDARVGYGSEFYATVETAEFAEGRDHVKLDLTPAYVVDSLESLVREFYYSRNGSESVEVMDTVRFSQPESFETAIITFADWEHQDDGSFLISDSEKSLRVEVRTESGELEFNHCVIQESSTPNRLSWKFKTAVTSAEVCFRITPA